jgi:hypothetical protein
VAVFIKGLAARLVLLQPVLLFLTNDLEIHELLLIKEERAFCIYCATLFTDMRFSLDSEMYCSDVNGGTEGAGARVRASRPPTEGEMVNSPGRSMSVEGWRRSSNGIDILVVAVAVVVLVLVVIVAVVVVSGSLLQDLRGIATRCCVATKRPRVRRCRHSPGKTTTDWSGREPVCAFLCVILLLVLEVIRIVYNGVGGMV